MPDPTIDPSKVLIRRPPFGVATTRTLADAPTHVLVGVYPDIEAATKDFDARAKVVEGKSSIGRASGSPSGASSAETPARRDSRLLGAPSRSVQGAAAERNPRGDLQQ